MTVYQCSPITVHLDLVVSHTDPGCCFFRPPVSPPRRRAGESVFLNTEYFYKRLLSCTRREREGEITRPGSRSCSFFFFSTLAKLEEDVFPRRCYMLPIAEEVLRFR